MTPWFKLWTNHLPVFEAAPDDALGRAIRAALVYCQTDQLPELDPLANLIFAVLRKDIDEALAQFQEAVESGKRGATTRWKKKESDNRDPMESDGDPIQPYRDPILPYGDPIKKMQKQKKLKKQEKLKKHKKHKKHKREKMQERGPKRPRGARLRRTGRA